MSTLEIALAALSVAVAVIGTVTTLLERNAKKRLSRLYRSSCQARCKDAVRTAIDLSLNARRACELVAECQVRNQGSRESSCGLAAPLTGNVSSIRTATNHLIGFCERLNDEYMEEFGEPVFPEFHEQLPHEICE